MKQTIKARFHQGILQPLEPLPIPEESEVQITVETPTHVIAEDIVEHAARVYQGLTAEEVAQIEAIALNRAQFFREPAA